MEPIKKSPKDKDNIIVGITVLGGSPNVLYTHIELDFFFFFYISLLKSEVDARELGLC